MRPRLALLLLLAATGLAVALPSASAAPRAVGWAWIDLPEAAGFQVRSGVVEKLNVMVDLACQIPGKPGYKGELIANEAPRKALRANRATIRWRETDGTRRAAVTVRIDLRSSRRATISIEVVTEQRYPPENSAERETCSAFIEDARLSRQSRPLPPRT